MAGTKKVKVDYNRLTVEKLAELYKNMTDDEKKAINFKEYMEEKPAKTELVDVIGVDGKPKYYVDKNGKTKIKKTRKPVGTEKKKVFNLMSAKRDFYKAYENKYEWLNKPLEKTSKENKNNKINNALKALGAID